MTYVDHIRSAAAVAAVIVFGSLLLWLGAANATAGQKPHHQHACKPPFCFSLDR